jgi:hypothetical protein
LSGWEARLAENLAHGRPGLERIRVDGLACLGEGGLRKADWAVTAARARFSDSSSIARRASGESRARGSKVAAFGVAASAISALQPFSRRDHVIWTAT